MTSLMFRILASIPVTEIGKIILISILLMIILVHAKYCFLCVLCRTCGRCVRKMDHHCPWFVLSMAILKYYCQILVGLHNKVTVPSCE